MTLNGKIKLKVKTIVTYQEKALINTVTTVFPKCQRISCLFHYKKDIIRNIKSYGLYNKANKNQSNIIIYKLGKLPFTYKGDIKYVIQETQNIINKYPIYKNFIENYFLKIHKEYFIDKSLDFSNIPNDCRSNSFLENYNIYIKQNLGKHRIVNWVNFINFIKAESSRSIEKLLKAANSNISESNQKQSDNSLKKAIDKPNNTKKFIIEEKKYELTEIFKDIKEQQNNIDKKEVINSLVYSTMGFKNLGETCYMNSAIQILIHMKNFIANLLETNYPNNINITNALKHLIYDIHMLNESAENNPFVKNSILYYSPIDFKVIITNKYPLYSTGQHDSMEFIRILLNELIEDNKTKDSIAKYYEINNNNKTKYEMYKEYTEFFNDREHSYIHDLFYFQVISTYKCTCGYKSYTCENLLEIPLNITEEKEDIYLNDLMKDLFTETEISWNNKCWQCKKKKKHTK